MVISGPFIIIGFAIFIGTNKAMARYAGESGQLA